MQNPKLKKKTNSCQHNFVRLCKCIMFANKVFSVQKTCSCPLFNASTIIQIQRTTLHYWREIWSSNCLERFQSGSLGSYTLACSVSWRSHIDQSNTLTSDENTGFPAATHITSDQSSDHFGHWCKFPTWHIIILVNETTHLGNFKLLCCTCIYKKVHT